MEVFTWGDLKQLLKAEPNSWSRHLIITVVYFSHSPTFLYLMASHRSPCHYVRWKKVLSCYSIILFYLRKELYVQYYNPSRKNKCLQCAEFLELYQDVPSAWKARWPEVGRYIDTWTMANIWCKRQRYEKSSLWEITSKDVRGRAVQHNTACLVSCVQLFATP